MPIETSGGARKKMAFIILKMRVCSIVVVVVVFTKIVCLFVVIDLL
jgi:hypothetical protein